MGCRTDDLEFMRPGATKGDFPEEFDGAEGLIDAGNGLKLLHTKPIGNTLGRMDYREIITIEPGKRSGKPCIRGTRMTVTDVLEYLASGMSHEQIAAIYDAPHRFTRQMQEDAFA